MSLGDSRPRAVASLTQTPLDLLVIGGGIVGSGIARDAFASAFDFVHLGLVRLLLRIGEFLPTPRSGRTQGGEDLPPNSLSGISL
jgi:hypothetical protein